MDRETVISQLDKVQHAYRLVEEARTKIDELKTGIALTSNEKQNILHELSGVSVILAFSRAHMRAVLVTKKDVNFFYGS